ncbi:MAG: hypothetical protein IJK35_06495 [Oscillospiraceae bacterium]|nr:hypothetical protein [Oscillospiraceae bacterium]
MTKQILRWTGKALLAGLIALALLCGFCYFYYNVPVHYSNPSGATEYVWEASRFYSRGTEGFAMGRTNNEGFYDARDLLPGETVDILLMGSSNAEGASVAQRDNMGSVLGALCGDGVRVYNIGTAGHNFLYCCKHLNAALETYAPTRCVVMEVWSLDHSPEEISAVLDGSWPEIPSHNEGWIVLLQKLPVLRLYYTKYLKGGALAFDGDLRDEDAPEPTEPQAYRTALSALLGKLADESAAHGVRLVLAYHPTLLLDERGDAYPTTVPEQLAVFSELCAEKGIVFVDLTERFLSSYENEALFSCGFSNTAPCSGHLNRVGHRLFAEGVYEALCTEGGLDR